MIYELMINRAPPNINTEEQEKDLLTDNLLMEKVRYILSSPSQCMEYKELTTSDDRINFFLNHFVMSDYAVRQLKYLYLSSEYRVSLFLNMIDELIREIENK